MDGPRTSSDFGQTGYPNMSSCLVSHEYLQVEMCRFMLTEHGPVDADITDDGFAAGVTGSVYPKFSDPISAADLGALFLRMELLLDYAMPGSERPFNPCYRRRPHSLSELHEMLTSPDPPFPRFDNAINHIHRWYQEVFAGAWKQDLLDSDGRLECIFPMYGALSKEPWSPEDHGEVLVTRRSALFR